MADGVHAAVDEIARDRIDRHEKFCEERGRNASMFEAEVRAELPAMKRDFSSGLSRIHSRIEAQDAALQERMNSQMRVQLGVATTIVLALMGAILTFIVGKI